MCRPDPPSRPAKRRSIMSGYGGFGLAVKPHYNSALGKLWLERGGTSVRPISAAAASSARAGTRPAAARASAWRTTISPPSPPISCAAASRAPGRIAAEGGSNGGILIANMLMRYPERFGALFCTMPLIDMRRYTKLLAGASWIAEYGDPDKPEDWAFLQTYSAYHAASRARTIRRSCSPPRDATTASIPATPARWRPSCRRWAIEAYFYEPAAGGHGYGKDNKERADVHRARLQLPEEQDRLGTKRPRRAAAHFRPNTRIKIIGRHLARSRPVRGRRLRQASRHRRYRARPIRHPLAQAGVEHRVAQAVCRPSRLNGP